MCSDSMCEYYRRCHHMIRPVNTDVCQQMIDAVSMATDLPPSSWSSQNHQRGTGRATSCHWVASITVASIIGTKARGRCRCHDDPQVTFSFCSPSFSSASHSCSRSWRPPRGRWSVRRASAEAHAAVWLMLVMIAAAEAWRAVSVVRLSKHRRSAASC